MCRLRANFARLGNPMQDCHLGKEPDSSADTVIVTTGGLHGGGRFLDFARNDRGKIDLRKEI